MRVGECRRPGKTEGIWTPFGLTTNLKKRGERRRNIKSANIFENTKKCGGEKEENFAKKLKRDKEHILRTQKNVADEDEHATDLFKNIDAGASSNIDARQFKNYIMSNCCRETRVIKLTLKDGI